MRTRVLPAARVLVTTLGIGSLALAQSRTHPAKPGSKTSAPTGPSSDGGAAAAPSAAEVTETSRLSPLNPAPNEFSEAGAPAAIDYEQLLATIASLTTRLASGRDAT